MTNTKKRLFIRVKKDLDLLLFSESGNDVLEEWWDTEREMVV